MDRELVAWVALRTPFQEALEEVDTDRNQWLSLGPADLGWELVWEASEALRCPTRWSQVASAELLLQDHRDEIRDPGILAGVQDLGCLPRT